MLRKPKLQNASRLELLMLLSSARDIPLYLAQVDMWARGKVDEVVAQSKVVSV